MIPDICGRQSRIWRFLTDTETSRAAFRSFRVTFASRFVSTQQGCIFLWADSSVFFLQGLQGNLIFWADFRSFRVSFAFRFVSTRRCVSKTVSFSGRTAPPSCLRTNRVWQAFLSFSSYLLVLVMITSKLCHMTLQSKVCSNLRPDQIKQDPENVSQYTIQT